LEASELDELRLYRNEHPAPDYIDMLAQICCLIYNTNRGKNSKALGIDDFKPRLIKVPPKRKKQL
jgi:hypothetical protein